jgi:hypothetical protein
VRTTTPFLGLRPPVRGGMATPAQARAFGDDTEVIGKELRLALASSDEASTLLKLLKNRAGRAAESSEPARARVAAASDGTALCTLIGPVSTVAAEGQDSPSSGIGVIPPDEAQPGSFQAMSASPGRIQQDTGRTITHVVGFQVSSQSVMFDGTAPLLVHETRKSHLALIDTGDVVFGAVSRAWDNTNKWERVRFTPSNKDFTEALDLYYPLYFPAGFSSWNNGNGPSLWFRYSASSGGTVTPSIAGSSFTASGTTGGSRAQASLGYGVVGAHVPSPGVVSWLRLRLVGSTQDPIDVETTVAFRFQQLRSY